MDDLYDLWISPSSDFNCSLLNGVNPYLTLLGLATIVFAVLYVTFHFTNGQYAQMKELYNAIRQERIKSKTKKDFFILTGLEVMWRLIGPVAIVGALRGFGIFCAANAVIAAYVLLRSGCL